MTAMCAAHTSHPIPKFITFVLMSGINKAIVLGRLGKDPEMRYTPAGVPVCTLVIATSEVYTDKNTNERKEITEWHNVVLWRKLAETAEKYLTKGREVYIEGKIRTRSWDDESGQKRYTTEVVADVMQLIGRGNEAPASGGQAYGYETRQPAAAAQQATSSPTVPDMGNEGDDDLPF
jgi:single-strand DNA-binding protein